MRKKMVRDRKCPALSFRCARAGVAGRPDPQFLLKFGGCSALLGFPPWQLCSVEILYVAVGELRIVFIFGLTGGFFV